MDFDLPEQFHMQQLQQSLPVLPDASSTSDKMLMWSDYSGGCDSGYSTQAPSISPYESSSVYESVTHHSIMTQQHPCDEQKQDFTKAQLAKKEVRCSKNK